MLARTVERLWNTLSQQHRQGQAPLQASARLLVAWHTAENTPIARCQTRRVQYTFSSFSTCILNNLKKSSTVLYRKETSLFCIFATALLQPNLTLANPPSGGDEINLVTDNSTLYRVHIFRNTGTFTIDHEISDVEYLIVGGGGAGGSGNWGVSGGGGGGEVKAGNFATLAAATYSVTVGDGGTSVYGDDASTGNGAPSLFNGVTALAGGGGDRGRAGDTGSGAAQGTGGGGGARRTGASQTLGGIAIGSGGDGADAYIVAATSSPSGGGGGGAGGDAILGNGGPGIASSITGSSIFYGGGGGGGHNSIPGTGGSGGGAAGSSSPTALSATDGFGGGGGGVYALAGGILGGSGGSGVVVIRYPNAIPTANAGPDQLNAVSASTVTLDGSASSDIDGSIATYTWVRNGGTGAAVALSDSTAISPTFTAPTLSTTDNPVTYSFDLMVTDNDGSVSVADSITVTVNPHTPETIASTHPVVSLVAEQGGQKIRSIRNDGGPVALTVQLANPVIGITPSFDWSSTEMSVLALSSEVNPVTNTLTIDPSSLASDSVIRARVAVTRHGLRADATLQLPVAIAGSSASDVIDSDGDGVIDALEGDLDASLNASSGNQLQTLAGEDVSFVMEASTGLVLRLGNIARAAKANQSTVSLEDIIAHSPGATTAQVIDALPAQTTLNQSQVFDFEITGLPQAGASVDVVLPLSRALSNGDTYMKYHAATGWQPFVENSLNRLASAPAVGGVMGICPPPANSAWKTGLNSTDACLRITLEDGGPNDADRLLDDGSPAPDGGFNGRIQDPGAIISTASAALSNPPNIITGLKGVGSIGWLVLCLLGGFAARRSM